MRQKSVSTMVLVDGMSVAILALKAATSGIALGSVIRLNRNAGMGKIIDRSLRKSRVMVNEVMELDSSEAILGMARAGLGAGVVPAGRLRLVPDGDVFTMPFGEPAIQRRVALIERSNNPRSDLSQLVYDVVMQVTSAVEVSSSE